MLLVLLGSDVATPTPATYQPHRLCGHLLELSKLILRLASRLDAFSAYPKLSVATLHCTWRHNRYTSGSCNPVLSY